MAGVKGKSGRHPGASFAQMVSFAERKKFVEFVLSTYMGDMRLATWMGDHLFPKPAQTIIGDPENPIVLQISGMKIVDESKS